MKKTIIAGTIAGSLLFSGNTLAASYTVKSGDSLWRISNRYNVSVPQLKTWNNLRSDLIYPGQVLTINGSSTGSSSTNSGGSSSISTYKVVSGDTFSKIAKKHNLSIAALKALNPSITNINFLRIGQVITVSGSSQSNNSTSTGSSSSNSSTSTTTTYTVKAGDTFSGIAKKFNISQANLLKLNPQITNINALRIGQVLTVSGKSNSSGSSGTISGDTISSTTSWEKKADAIINTGSKYLGRPYVYGASVNQTNSFDCSSFTMRVFQENGITLPRTSITQSKVGTSVGLSNIRKGDLVFFDTDYNGVINHVAIAMSSTSILHCQSSVGVSISSLNTYWKPRVVKVTRVL